MIIKSNYFVSVCHIISKQIGRKIFPFMSAKEVMDIKNNINVYQFPIKNYYNQKCSILMKDLVKKELSDNATSSSSSDKNNNKTDSETR